MTERPSIQDLAFKAVEQPETLSHAEIIRLGAWLTDHDEHIAAFQRDAARSASPAPTRIERLGESARTRPVSIADTPIADIQASHTGAMLPLPEQQTEAPTPAQVQS